VSYDESPPPVRRRFRLSVTVAALVPAALAGWLIWNGTNGPGGEDGAPAAASVTRAAATAGLSAAAAGHTGGGRADGGAKKSPPAPRTAGPLAGKVVVIDPGHNPHNYQHTKEINRLVNIGTSRKACDTTGTATNSGYSEAAFTLDVSHRLRGLLEKAGAKVLLTQDGDRPYGPCVDERARIGNTAHADAVVSIHADGSAAGNRGFHVILPARVKGGGANTTAIVGPSRDLGERIVGDFARATGTNRSNYIGGGTGLDVRSDLGGLNMSTVPKVFIECANMRDPKDAALVTSSAWRQRAAQGLAEGISDYLRG